MPCTTVALLGSTNCLPAIGGAARAYVCKYSEITSFTVAAGLITAVVMVTTGSWKLWNPTQDRTAYLNATGQDPQKNIFYYDQVGYLKYDSTSKDAIKAANSMTPCCDLVVCWFLHNGTVLFTGVEFNDAGTGIVQSLEPAKYVPSILSGQGDDPSKVEFLIKSKAKNQAVADDAIITITYMAAL